MENETLEIEVAFDYRCPFARNANEVVLAGLEAGASWTVHFVPFSLSQAKVEPGGTDVWDAPETDSGLLALQLAMAIRDTQPQHFLAAHCALFSSSADHGGDLRSEVALRGALATTDVDVDAAFEHVASGVAMKTVRDEHTRLVDEHEVWGVPAFIVGGNAAFVRLMDRPSEDAAASIAAIERIADMLGTWPELNEFKHFTVSR